MIRTTALHRALIIASLLMLLAVLPVPAELPETFRTAWYRGRPAAANEVLVRFAASGTGWTSAAARRSVEASEEIVTSRPIGDGGVIRFRSRRWGTAELIRRLSRRRDVAFVEPNYVVRTARTPNDPHFDSLWGLLNTGQTINRRTGIPGADIHAAPAWDITTGSTATVTAVIDSGIDYRHPDLAANMWHAPRPFTVTLGGATLTCPAGAHGYNVLKNSFDPLDDFNHGTHCAGIIGAVGNDGFGIPGVNWTASIMGLKFLDAGGNGTAAGAVDAIEFAVQARQALGPEANVRVLSNSWTVYGPSQALLEAIQRADQQEMLFVAAAGNSGADLDLAPIYPQSYLTPNMINVAATDMGDRLIGFSNYGAATVHLGAPGYNIISTVRSGGYATMDGTSMAAPHVSGTAALMLAVNPYLSVEELKTGLLDSAEPRPTLTGKTVTGGRLNAWGAVSRIAPRADFHLELNGPPTQIAVQGESAGYEVAVNVDAGFLGTVKLSAVGLPPRATAEITPPTISGAGTATVRVRTALETPVGLHYLAIRGTSGTLAHAFTVTLSVLPAPRFTLSVTPAVRTVRQRRSARYLVRINRTGENSDPIDLSIAEVPPGCVVRFSRRRLKGTSRSVLSVKTTLRSPPGSYALTVTGTCGSTVQSGSTTLIVQPR